MREARAGSRRARALHVTRAARQRLGLPAARFGLYGRVLELDPAAAYAWAARLGGGASGAELVAAVALHELMHALIEAYPGPTGDRPFRRAWARLEGAVDDLDADGFIALAQADSQASQVEGGGGIIDCDGVFCPDKGGKFVFEGLRHCSHGQPTRAQDFQYSIFFFYSKIHICQGYAPVHIYSAKNCERMLSKSSLAARKSSGFPKSRQ